MGLIHFVIDNMTSYIIYNIFFNNLNYYLIQIKRVSKLLHIIQRT